MHNNLDHLGSFECSDPVLTQLHKNTAWTIKTIFQGAPMSNANSEKYGWTGDAHLFAEPTNMIFNARSFWSKWLQDIRDAQLYYQSGNVVSTVPNYRRDSKTTSATWGAAYPLIAWYNYVYYNDVKALSDHYEGITDWVNHLSNRAPEGLIKGVWADHVPPGVAEDGTYIQRGMSNESSELIGSVYFYQSVQILKKAAIILGKEADVPALEELSTKIKEAINNKYFDSEKGHYVVPPAPKGFHAEQAANLIPLQYGLVPEGKEKMVLDYVLNDIKKHDNHLTTGIVGTKAMVDVLPAKGYSELFYEVATQETYPGWGYWIKLGATTHWQHWSGDVDHNHAMFGSISNFLVHDIAGIRIPTPDDGTVGYKHIHFKPFVLKDLNYARAKVPSNYGLISCGWSKTETGLNVELEIPAGSTATFTLPLNYSKLNTDDEDMKILKNQIGEYYLLLGSGKYNFMVQ